MDATAHMNEAQIMEIAFPDVMSREELAEMTLEKAGKILLSTNEEVPERDFYIRQMNNAYAAVSGDIGECSSIAEYLFTNEQLPKLFDPYMAYQWHAWGCVLTSEENYMAFRGMPGGDCQGTSDMFYESMAEMVLMFGSREQKLKALRVMKGYIDKYWGAAFLCTDRFIYALMGMPPSKSARALGHALTDVPVDRDLAIEYYKRMIDADIARNDHNHAGHMAKAFEKLLGIEYYKPNQGSRPEQGKASKSRKGCYVATCVYGSYDCPQVWTLRRFRDNVLAEHALGRMFIRCYYAVSPCLVRAFGGCSAVRRIWRGLLDRMVAALNEKGFQNTPYED